MRHISIESQVKALLPRDTLAQKKGLKKNDMLLHQEKVSGVCMFSSSCLEPEQRKRFDWPESVTCGHIQDLESTLHQARF